MQAQTSNINYFDISKKKKIDCQERTIIEKRYKISSNKDTYDLKRGAHQIKWTNEH